MAGLDPALLSGPDALVVLEVLTEAQRIATAGQTLVAKRVEESNVWAREGHRSPEQFLAQKTGTTPSEVEATLATAHRLDQAPATEAAFRDGKLSPRQAAEVAAATQADPGEERRLLELAGKSTVKQLRYECRRVRHAATDERARYQKIKAERHLHTWTDAEGAFCFKGRTTPDAGARMAAVLAAETDARFKEARAAGEREPLAAYAMDALERRVCGAGQAPARTKLVINGLIDLEALRRGHTEPGETCEIAGIGPVPVDVVRQWEGDKYLRLLVTHGIDIKAVTRKTRYVDDGQRADVLVRERFACSLSNCDASRRLQLDHCRIDFARDGPTEVDNLTPLCAFHHALKTKGWKLTGRPGHWELAPP